MEISLIFPHPISKLSLMVGGSQLWILSESWDPEKIQWPSLWNVIVLKNMKKSGSRLQYFVPRHFIEQTSMRKKEVSKKKTLLQYLQPFLAFCMLQRPKTLCLCIRPWLIKPLISLTISLLLVPDRSRILFRLGNEIEGLQVPKVDSFIRRSWSQ